MRHFSFAALVVIFPFLLFAQTAYIPARELGATLVREIGAARSSIFAYYYLFALYPGRTQTQTARIADALAAAKKRGVRVEVVLDGGVYSGGEPVETMQEDNREAAEYLRQAGVDVFFDDAAATLHAKAMVIDSQTVILGSANISEGALEKNIETTVLTRSRETALALLGELGNMARRRPAPSDSTAALIPLRFLSDTALLCRMVKRQDERSFDLFLLLCKQSYSRRGPNTSLDLDYAATAFGLGIDTMAANDFRRQINKTLGKLQDDYGLATVTLHWGKNAQVLVKDLPKDSAAAMPAAYWQYGWQKRLGFGAKVMVVLGTHFSAISAMRPRWSLAASTIAGRYGVSEGFVREGTVELRRANLLDVQYNELPQDKDETRRPNIYTPLAFYDPAALDAGWQDLEKRYGAQQTARARAIAVLLYKDCDVRAVEQFILLERKYGREKLEHASAIMGEKSPDNPRRTVGYFIRTVENMK